MERTDGLTREETLLLIDAARILLANEQKWLYTMWQSSCGNCSGPKTPKRVSVSPEAYKLSMILNQLRDTPLGRKLQ